MNGEWESGRLADFADVVMGTSPPGDTTNEVGEGVPLLNGPTEFTSHSPVAVQFTTSPVKLCEPGDILFCVRGSTTGRMNWADQEYAIGRGLAAIRHREGISYQPYVRGVIEYALPRLLAVSTGSTFPSVSRSDIENVTVQVPPLREQQAIACILGALDDKIELNRRRNRTLEAMARAIFQSWFIDFEPVKAKAAGRTPSGLKPELAALFPDRFEDSPLGPIPAGWRVGTVGEVVTLSRESIVPGEFPDEVFDHYSIPAYDAGQNPLPETGSTIKSQKFIVTNDCVLVSKLNPKTPRVWIPDVDKSRRPIASTEFLVCRPKASDGFGRAYFYGLACDKTFSEHLTSRASGTSNSHQRVRPQDFLSYEIPLPAAKFASEFNDKVEPILDRVLLIKNESRTLAALRDALLPKLISGELRVPDAERIVGRAV